MKDFNSNLKFVLQFYLSISLEDFGAVIQNMISPQSFWSRALNVVKFKCAAFLKLAIGLVVDRSLNANNRHLIFVISENNVNATKFLNDTDIPFTYLVPFGNKVKNQLESKLELTYTYEFFYKLKYLFHYVRFLIKERGARRLYDVSYKSIGLFEESVRYLKILKPQVIVFSNDHTPQCRALLLASKKLNITSIYIQHASINHFCPFPPLSFDYSLLEGEFSRNAYGIDSKSKISLVGMPKFDSYVKDRKTKQKELLKIGIAYSINDEIDMVERLIKSILEALPKIKVIVRPHPAESRKMADFGIYKSDSTKENSFEFIKDIDLLIASDSSIHLEACLLNVQSIYINLNSKSMNDSYGYIQNEICQEVKDLGELQNSITNYSFSPNHFLKAKKYVDLVGTDRENQSAQEVYERLKEVIDS